MRIAFVGLPVAALCLAHDGHTVVWAGVCRREAPGTRRLIRLLGRERVDVVPDLGRVTEKVKSLAPDRIVSWFWTKKIPKGFLAIAPAIGVHPSLLPRHRGPDPFFWAIDAGDEVTGVTAHVLEEEYDTGAILAQRELRIDPAWNAWTLAKKLDRPSLALLREVVRAPPARVPQDDAKATLAPQPDDEQLEIRWTWSSERVARRVRAAAPWPGAFTDLGGETVVLTRVAPTADYPKVLEPGQAFVRKDGTAIVRTGDGAVELLAGRFDADDDERTLGPEDLAEVVEAAREIAP